MVTSKDIYENQQISKAFLDFIQIILSGEELGYYDYNGPKNDGSKYSVFWKENETPPKYVSNTTSKAIPQRLDKYTINDIITLKDPQTIHKSGRFQCETKFLEKLASDAGVEKTDLYDYVNQNLIGFNIILTAGVTLTHTSHKSKDDKLLSIDIGRQFIFGTLPFTEEWLDHFQLACATVFPSISVPYDTYNASNNKKISKGNSYFSTKKNPSVQREAFHLAATNLRKTINGDELTSNTTNNTPTSVISGSVVDTSGNPIQDAKVTVTTYKYPKTPFQNTTESNAFRVWLLNKYPDYNDKRKQPGYPPSVLYRVDVPPQPYINSEALKKAYYERGKEYEEENGLPKTEIGEVIVDQTIVTTDKDGNWSTAKDINISDTATGVSIFTDSYELINIGSILPPPSGSNIYTIPRATLFPSPDPVKSASEQLVTEMNENESDQIEKEFTNKSDKIVLIVNQLNKLKENLKRLLTPFVLKLIAAYGPTLMQAVLKNLPLDQLKNLINCPSSASLVELISQRNKLARQINNIYNKIQTLNVVLDTSNKIITSLKLGIQIIESIPYPATGIPPLGLPPLTAGAIQKIGSAKDKIFKTLETAQGIVDIATLTSASLGVVMGIVLRLLNTLDTITQYCAKDQNISFETINNNLNSFVNESTGESNSDVINNTQNNNNNYKGFKLELKLDETNKTQYPRRYAQALTKQGVPVLKTESSFASDPQVMLDQLKFIIDSNPNITAE